MYVIQLLRTGLLSSFCQLSALALAGDALTSNIYLDIPLLIRGLRISFLSARSDPTGLILSAEMLRMLRDSKPDPRDQSSVVKEYMHPWWTWAAEWKEKPHVLFDIDAAFESHADQVSWFLAPLASI